MRATNAKLLRKMCRHIADPVYRRRAYKEAKKAWKRTPKHLRHLARAEARMF